MLTKEEIKEGQKTFNDPAALEKAKEISRHLDEELTGLDLKEAPDSKIALAVLHHYTNTLITGVEAMHRHEEGQPLSFPSQSKTPIPELAVKPLLELKEVERLTSLSRVVLYEAICNRKLKAVFIDHELHVCRPDLDTFLENL